MNEKLEAFVARAGFHYGWSELESWARRMAKQAVKEQDALAARLAEAEDAIERAGRCLAMSNKGAAEALSILMVYKQFLAGERP